MEDEDGGAKEEDSTPLCPFSSPPKTVPTLPLKGDAFIASEPPEPFFIIFSLFLFSFSGFTLADLAADCRLSRVLIALEQGTQHLRSGNQR